MWRCSKRFTDEVARTIAGNDCLQLREVFWIEFVVFDKIGSCFGVSICAEHTHNILFQLWLVVNQELGSWNTILVNQIKDQLQQVKLFKESKFGY